LGARYLHAIDTQAAGAVSHPDEPVGGFALLSRRGLS
jgi:hypothetical protein